MLSQLIVDLEVVRSLVSQNGKKIGEIETDIKNKSDANENAHQHIEGTNSQRSFSPIPFFDHGLRSLTPINIAGIVPWGLYNCEFKEKIVLQRVSQ